MSDSDLLFTERLFQASRVDPAWESEEANRRRAAWNEASRKMREETIAHRESMSLDERMTEVMRRLAVVSAQMVDRTGGYNEFGLPRSNAYELGYLRANDVLRHMEVDDDATAIFHVRALEEALDAHLGHGQRKHGDTKPLIGAEKDKMILEEYVGLSPQQVSQIDPDLGSPKVIEHVRRNAKLNISDGTPKTRKHCFSA